MEMILKRLCIYILVLNYGTAISVGRPPYRINFIPVGFTKCGSVDLSPFYFNFFFPIWKFEVKDIYVIDWKNIDSFLLKIFCNWFEMIES